MGTTGRGVLRARFLRGAERAVAACVRTELCDFSPSIFVLNARVVRRPRNKTYVIPQKVLCRARGGDMEYKWKCVLA